MSKANPKTIAAHLTAIQNGPITKSNIIGIRRLFNAHERKACGWSERGATPSDYDRNFLAEETERCEPLVSPELFASGIRVLSSPRYAKRLAPYADMIAEAKEIRLHHWSYLDSGSAVPSYRLITKHGDGFRFRVVPWQSGGNGPEIHGVDY